jgi:hypothetical protein
LDKIVKFLETDEEIKAFEGIFTDPKGKKICGHCYNNHYHGLMKGHDDYYEKLPSGYFLDKEEEKHDTQNQGEEHSSLSEISDRPDDSKDSGSRITSELSDFQTKKQEESEEITQIQVLPPSPTS